jgi:protein-S-isoprenylcysteine O-methyltransferase Ste14
VAPARALTPGRRSLVVSVAAACPGFRGGKRHERKDEHRRPPDDGAWDARPAFVPLRWPARAALAWDAFLSLVFFVQHSAMVRRPFRARLANVLPARYDGAFYAICSGLTLTLVLVLWQRVDIPVFRLEGIARWITVALSGLAVALLVVSGYAVRRTLDIFGLRPIRAHLRGRPVQSAPFSVDGPFRWVRHPLYACILALLWIRPEMMADGLLLSILWSGWMVAGTVLEERDLVADFGDVYRRYQQQVPMLVPWRGPAR